MPPLAPPAEPLPRLPFSIEDHDVARWWARKVRPLVVRLAVTFDHQNIEEAFEVYTLEARQVRWLLHRTPAAIVVTDIGHAAGHGVGGFGNMEEALQFIAADWTRIDAAD
jgi:hypothetical protein